MANFEGVVPALGQALQQHGFDVLTPVQEAVLEPELSSGDLLVSAQTGSGKTVAFGLALAPTLLAGAERFAVADGPLALVVAPTRELALQVKRELEWLYKPTGASVVSCVGGMDMRTERRALQRGAHIVVGTPGRLRDHIERKSLDMTALKGVVLDEADEMLDLGFREDLEFILGAAPKDRRTLMFSATVPRTIATLAKRFQRDAVRISTQAEQSQHLDIEYQALVVAGNERENAIINVLRYFEVPTALVFCATRAAVNHMTARFTNRGFSVVALSGELSQAERSHALQAMRDGRAKVCIATDVAARGIDLPKCELVIHADLPRNREGLLHRSGRTGRAGRKGVAVLMVPHNWRKRTERLLQGAGVQATWARPPSVVEIMRRDDERLLADPDLNEPVGEDEADIARELLARHGAEQIAAAFVRRSRAGRSAPEELLDTGPMDRSSENKGKRRDDFKDGVWFSLSVGRKQNAEPRWLLPMLCRAGNITKREIGAIRIEQGETFVELAPGCVEGFLEALGPNATVEKDIIVSRSDGPAKGPKGEPGAETRREKPYGKIKREPRRTMLEPDKAPTPDERPMPATKRPKNKKLKRAKKARLAESRSKAPNAARQGCGPIKRTKPRKKPPRAAST
ncbi:MAG: DEAD/DEAH box helicase [Rhodospirillaceae bacterium]|nr:DEAD/DEAH box helicase [Rhodospirillaceae bacterium]MBT5894514.1 DEAD/DEAH box helicase [Rhodospirillaceae bacterium]MBT6427983.1 DEAD/DEAH box helicase [Rhodospirillaceae bacterium]